VEEMSILTRSLQTHWATIEPILSIRNEREYHRAVKRLNELLDIVGDHVRHPLYGLLDTLGTLIHAYEEKHYPMPSCSGAEMLRFLMDEHDLTAADLPELGSPNVVADILNGKHELSVQQIRILAKRFHVSPAVFI
jgi:HTH-type transcriptional regulator/antitoxin HigA